MGNWFSRDLLALLNNTLHVLNKQKTNTFTIKAAIKTILHQANKKLRGFRLPDPTLVAVLTLRVAISAPKHSNFNYDKIINHYLDEETVTPNELLPEHWGAYRSDEELERNMCKTTPKKTTKDAQPRERNVAYNESRFRSSKIHRANPLEEPAVQINIAKKRQPNKRSKKNLDWLYDVLAPGSVVQKTDQ